MLLPNKALQWTWSLREHAAELGRWAVRLVSAQLNNRGVELPFLRAGVSE